MTNANQPAGRQESKLSKLPGLSFGKKTSMFSGGKVFQTRMPGERFVPPQIRITQSKGSGGK